MIPHEKSYMWPKSATEIFSCKTKVVHYLFFSDEFGLRSPVIRKKKQPKKATSMVAYIRRLPSHVVSGEILSFSSFEESPGTDAAPLPSFGWLSSSRDRPVTLRL